MYIYHIYTATSYQLYQHTLIILDISTTRFVCARGIYYF